MRQDHQNTLNSSLVVLSQFCFSLLGTPASHHICLIILFLLQDDLFFLSPLQKGLMVDQCATEPSIVLPQVQIAQTLVVDEFESHTLAADRDERYLSSPRICRSESGVLRGYHSSIIALSFKLLKPDFLVFIFIKSRGHILTAIRGQGTISQVDYRFIIKKCNSGTAIWKRYIGQDRGKEHGASLPSRHTTLSGHILSFTNLEAPQLFFLILCLLLYGRK